MFEVIKFSLLTCIVDLVYIVDSGPIPIICNEVWYVNSFETKQLIRIILTFRFQI